MLLLNPGYTKTVNLAANQTLYVETLGLAVVTVVSGLGITAGVLASVDGSQTFGPYSIDGVLTIAATKSDCTYGVSDVDNVARLATTPGGGVALVGAGGRVATAFVQGLIYDSTTSADTLANQAAIQAALVAGDCTIYAPPGSTVYHADTLVVPANTKLATTEGVRLQQAGPYGRLTGIRLGNVERSGSRGINGLMVIAHTAVTEQGTGTVRVVKAGGNYTFSYRGPGEASYGTGVVLTASNKATLVSGSHVLLMRSALTNIPLSDGTYTQNVLVVPSAMPARPCTLARSGTTVTVSETAHKRKSGDLVMIFGHGTGDGMFRLTTTDANTYTYSDPTGSGTGAAYAYANSDVELNFAPGSSVWSGEANAATTTDSMMMQFLLTNGLTTRGGSFKNRGLGKYCGNIQGITRGRFYDPHFDDTCSDGFTCQGGAFDVRIMGSNGGSQVDNLHGIGCTPSDFFAIHRPAENGTNGVDGYYVQCTAKNQVIEAVRIFGGKSNVGGLSARMENIDVFINGNFTGTAGSFSLIEDTGTPALLDSLGLEVGRVDAELNVESAPNIFWPPASMSAATAPNTVDSLTVSGSYKWSNTNGALGYSPAFFVHASGNITNFVANGVRVTDLKAGGTRFAGVLSRKGGVISKGTIRGGRAVGTTRVLSLDNAIAQSGIFEVDGVDCSDVDFVMAGNAWVNAVSFSNISGQVNTALYNNTAAAPATKARISGSGELVNKTANITGAGANASVNGLTCDGTKLAPNAGDVFYNSNAAFGAGVGLYAYGTAATRIAA